MQPAVSVPFLTPKQHAGAIFAAVVLARSGRRYAHSPWLASQDGH
eukprot:SAG31_NODE_270_length_18732_cov_9.342618_8_plen_45_part_00